MRVTTNEIDIITVNEADKGLVIGDIKRNSEKIDLTELKEKAQGIVLHHKRWDIRYVGLSLKDL